jgi:PTH1 family peptidyl-tRNA hydrolase
MFVRRVAKDWKVRLKKRTFHSKTGLMDSGKRCVWLVLPQTYMNQCGQAVQGLLQGRGIKPERLVVVYDDLDIPLGEVRIRKEGGAGTHRGMSSIIEEIQTTQFPRIRIGIGPLDPEEDAVDFVLSQFRREEKPLLKQSLEAAQEALGLILAGETEKAMNIYNKRKIGQGPRSEEPVLE